jgi:hypothetical protein
MTAKEEARAGELSWELVLRPSDRALLRDAADAVELEHFRLRDQLEQEKFARVAVSNTLWAHIGELYEEIRAAEARLEAVRALVRTRRELDGDTSFLLDALEAALTVLPPTEEK